MRQKFPTKELQEENEKLTQLFFEIPEEQNISMDEFLKKNASKKYLEYLEKQEKSGTS